MSEQVEKPRARRQSSVTQSLRSDRSSKSKKGTDYSKLVAATAPPYAPHAEYVPPTSYETLELDGLVSMARLFVTHHLHGLRPRELLEAMPNEFNQVKHLNFTITLHYDQHPCWSSFRRFLRTWRRGFINGTLPPLFNNLETFHLTIIYHHPDKSGNVPIKTCLYSMIEGVFSMISAKHVRVVYSMVQEPRAPCTCAEEAKAKCTCQMHDFSHGYTGNWFPIQDKLEGMLSTYPLESYDLPFFTRTLPLANMGMTMDCGFEMDTTKAQTPHPVPAFANKVIKAITYNPVLPKDQMARPKKTTIHPLGSPDKTLVLSLESSDTPPCLSPAVPAKTTAKASTVVKNTIPSIAAIHGRSMIAYLEESGAWRKPAKQTHGRRFDDWNAKHTGPAWMSSGMRVIHKETQKEFLSQVVLQALPIKGSTKDFTPSDQIKTVWSKTLQSRLRPALEEQMVKSKPFKLDSGAAWRKWVAAGQDVKKNINSMSREGFSRYNF